jgi:hypothetical protein
LWCHHSWLWHDLNLLHHVLWMLMLVRMSVRMLM